MEVHSPGVAQLEAEEDEGREMERSWVGVPAGFRGVFELWGIE